MTTTPALETLLEQSFGKDTDLSLLDGDSRTMKQRFRDLFSFTESRARKEERDLIIKIMKEDADDDGFMNLSYILELLNNT